MLYDSIHHLWDLCGEISDERILDCLKRVEAGEFDALAEGTYELDKDEVFFFRNDFETLLPEEKEFEAHRKYMDIHLVLEGEERIDVAFAERLGEWDFPEDKDIAFLSGKADAELVLSAGDFLICCPRDAHKPGLAVNGKKQKVKKITFKIKVRS